MGSKGLNPVIEFYRGIIDYWVNLAKEGKSLPYGKISRWVNDDAFIIKNAVPKTYNVNQAKKKHWQTRQEVLVGELYDKLKTVEDIKLGSIEEIVSEVNDPLLDIGVNLLKANGGFGKYTRGDFVNGLDPRLDLENIKLGRYLRPLVLLELLIQHSDKISDLKQSSTYFPHRIYRDFWRSLIKADEVSAKNRK